MGQRQTSHPRKPLPRCLHIPCYLPQLGSQPSDATLILPMTVLSSACPTEGQGCDTGGPRAAAGQTSSAMKLCTALVRSRQSRQFIRSVPFWKLRETTRKANGYFRFKGAMAVARWPVFDCRPPNKRIPLTSSLEAHQDPGLHPDEPQHCWGGRQTPQHILSSHAHMAIINTVNSRDSQSSCSRKLL